MDRPSDCRRSLRRRSPIPARARPGPRRTARGSSRHPTPRGRRPGARGDRPGRPGGNRSRRTDDGDARPSCPQDAPGSTADAHRPTHPRDDPERRADADDHPSPPTADPHPKDRAPHQRDDGHDHPTRPQDDPERTAHAHRPTHPRDDPERRADADRPTHRRDDPVCRADADDHPSPPAYPHPKDCALHQRGDGHDHPSRPQDDPGRTADAHRPTHPRDDPERRADAHDHPSPTAGPRPTACGPRLRERTRARRRQPADGLRHHRHLNGPHRTACVAGRRGRQPRLHRRSDAAAGTTNPRHHRTTATVHRRSAQPQVGPRRSSRADARRPRGRSEHLRSSDQRTPHLRSLEAPHPKGVHPVHRDPRAPRPDCPGCASRKRPGSTAEHQGWHRPQKPMRHADEGPPSPSHDRPKGTMSGPPTMRVRGTTNVRPTTHSRPDPRPALRRRHRTRIGSALSHRACALRTRDRRCSSVSSACAASIIPDHQPAACLRQLAPARNSGKPGRNACLGMQECPPPWGGGHS